MTGNKNAKRLKSSWPRPAEIQMKPLLPEIEKGFNALLKNKENIVCQIQGAMTYFPLCCSTGVLKNLQATYPSETHAPAFNKGEAITGVNVGTVKAAKYIHQIVRACATASRPIFFPIEVARWNAMSLILIKAKEGKDDSGDHAYGNYKCAQVTMCDRIVADKRNKKFRFGGYNIVFSVDQFMDFLDAEGEKYGEFYSSPPVPGGHGARVRAGIFTPNHDALQKYNDERIERVREHVLFCLAQGGTKVKAADKVAANW
jgi:hypothetical protein